MRILRSSFFRALVAIICGVLLIQFRVDMMTWLTKGIGILFFVTGLVSCISYYVEKRKIESTQLVDADGRKIYRTPGQFPIVGLGSIVFGLVLTFMTATFIVWVMYILAAILVLGAINQYYILAQARQFAHVPLFYWFPPTIILLVAVLVIFYPMESAVLPLQIIGWCMVFYGVVDCIDALKLYSLRKRIEKESQVQDAEEVSDSEAGE